jgi:hypothetical protein
MPAHSRSKNGVARSTMSQASTFFLLRQFNKQGVDGRDKPGHDGGEARDTR